MKNSYHQKETVTLRSDTKIERRVLHGWLKKQGFKAEDEFYYLPRKDKAERWQIDTLMTVNVLLDGEEIYETEDDVDEGIASHWDTLEVDYLMAYLPKECICVFLAEIQKLIETFDLQIEYSGKTQTVSSLGQEFESIAEMLEKEWGGAGSETLAIFIDLDK